MKELLKRNSWVLPICLIALTCAISYNVLSIYLVKSFNMYAGLMLTPFIVYVREPSKYSNRFGILALFCLVGYALIGIKTLYYLCFAFTVLLIIESFFGMMNNIVIALVVLLGSISQYFIKLFSFPIRLELTELAGAILSFFGLTVEVAGNILNVNGLDFSVDPECMGLKMVTTSLLAMFLFISLKERNKKRKLSFLGTTYLASTTLFFVLFANLLRILALVLFKSFPETASHELIGIISLCVYAILPIWWNSSIAYKTLSKPIKAGISMRHANLKFSYAVLAILVIGLSYFNLIYNPTTIQSSPLTMNMNLKGYDMDTTAHNVVQLKSDTSLIYIKPPMPFYGSDHNPSICWLGSGYKFEKETILDIGNYKVFYGLLSGKHGEMLHTSWWYDNGLDKTINQLDWRWSSLKGAEEYRLVNVTCSNMKDLQLEVEKLLTQNIFEKHATI